MLGEPFEWRGFGSAKVDMKLFTTWLAEIGETHVASIRTLMILQHEHAVHTGTRALTERQLAKLVTGSKYIRKYRDRKVPGNPTRYRVTSAACLRLARAA